MADIIDVSVIVPTYNGAHKLPNILLALKNQTYSNFELIVAVDGSSDNSLLILEDWKSKLPNLKIVQQGNRGRASTRNLGSQNASGELLIFLDDDMIPENDCVFKHIHHHQKIKNTILVGGQTDNVQLLTSDIQLYRSSLSRKWIRSYFNGERPLKKDEVYITAANFSINSTLFQELNGFDERLRDLEDNDLARRAFLKDIKIYVNSNIIALHNDFITIESYIKRNIDYRLALNSMLQLNPHYLKTWNFSSTVKYYKFKKMFYYWFSFKLWIKIVDRTNYLKILPKKIRYFIYNTIITSHYLYYPNKLNGFNKTHNERI